MFSAKNPPLISYSLKRTWRNLLAPYLQRRLRQDELGQVKNEFVSSVFLTE